MLLMTSRRSGSPPRVRGKGWGGIDGIRLEGITPACAGKSCFVHLVESFHWDHPRVCGEKQASCPEAPLFAGSPPRVRGKGIQPRYHRVAMGITPACAGKSNICGQNRVKSEDHPRACGEKNIKHRRKSSGKGSPPRVRGKANSGSFLRLRYRITPARAGKSSAMLISSSSTRDHPRACGEKHPICCYPPVYPGSPPRVRGKALRSGYFELVDGITPARAGKS